MIQERPRSDLIKQQVRESLRLEILNSRAVTIAKHDHVYTCGDRDEMVCFIESGQIKLLIETNENHFLVIKEKKLTDYLDHIA